MWVCVLSALEQVSMMDAQMYRWKRDNVVIVSLCMVCVSVFYVHVYSRFLFAYEEPNLHVDAQQKGRI